MRTRRSTTKPQPTFKTPIYRKFVQIKPEGIYVPEYSCTYALKDSKEWNNAKGESIVKWMLSAVNGKVEKEQVDEIGVNSFYLKTLSACLGDNRIVMKFNTNRNAIKVTPRSEEFTHYGYITPISLAYP